MKHLFFNHQIILHKIILILTVSMHNIFFVTKRDDFKRSAREERGKHQAKLIEAFRACGVPFSIWRDKQGNLDWTSLMGTEKKKLITKLPQHFPSILPEGICDKVTRLWLVSGFAVLCSVIRRTQGSDEKIKIVGKSMCERQMSISSCLPVSHLRKSRKSLQACSANQCHALQLY